VGESKESELALEEGEREDELMEFFRSTQRCKLQLSLLETDSCSLERARENRVLQSIGMVAFVGVDTVGGVVWAAEEGWSETEMKWARGVDIPGARLEREGSEDVYAVDNFRFE